MRRRYENGNKQGRVIVFFDEIQEGVGDEVIVDADLGVLTVDK